jgi:hypothetical protein
MDRETFAALMFAADAQTAKENPECYEPEELAFYAGSFADAPADVRNVQLEEADHYLANIPQDQWPSCVLEAMQN